MRNRKSTKLDLLACRQCKEYTYFVDPFGRNVYKNLIAVQIETYSPFIELNYLEALPKDRLFNFYKCLNIDFSEVEHLNQ